MKQTILPVTVHLNIRLPLALLQPESRRAHWPGAGDPYLPVLQLDRELETALFHGLDTKRCTICDTFSPPTSTGPDTARNVLDA